ncbi:glycosyltransferase, partial [Pseudonocardia sp. EV170527-09]|uniref:glycosyltransferase n=1 Tax=Pseudonocardia sp. EV170527-09 TaxID=2603411 RepID=UPI001386871F
MLLLGPAHDGGSLPPYLDVLTTALRQQGATVTRLGSTQIPYDTTTGRFWPAPQLRAAAAELTRQIDPAAHDVIALHAGNLEYDQIVPALLPAGLGLPVVHHIHTLAPTLLHEHSPDPDLQAAVDDATRRAAGHVWFGTYARHHQPQQPAQPEQGRVEGAVQAGVVAWLPSTIPPGTQAHAGTALAAALDTDRPVVSLSGYAAPWKDPALLLDALAQTRTPVRAVLAGPGWDDPAQAGVDLTGYAVPRPVGRHAELVVVPGYLDPGARLALVTASTAAAFPYRPHPSFQGSGAIADYLAHHVPVVATDTANFTELIGPAGTTTPPEDPARFAAGIDHVLTDPRPAAAARQRAPRFTAAAHAARCLTAYRAARATAGDRPGHAPVDAAAAGASAPVVRRPAPGRRPRSRPCRSRRRTARGRAAVAHR